MKLIWLIIFRPQYYIANMQTNTKAFRAWLKVNLDQIKSRGVYPSNNTIKECKLILCDGSAKYKVKDPSNKKKKKVGDEENMRIAGFCFCFSKYLKNIHLQLRVMFIVSTTPLYRLKIKRKEKVKSLYTRTIFATHFFVWLP